MKKNSVYSVLVALIVSIGGLLLGMSSTIGGALEFFKVQFGLTPFQEGFIGTASMLGTFVGNFFVGTISDRLGRKKSLMLAAFLFSFLALGSGLAPNYFILFLTRFIGGFGIGLSLLCAPLYLAEFSPAERRGVLVSFNQLNIGIGFFLAAVSNYVIDIAVADPELKWRIMLAAGTVFSVIYILGLLAVPESPRWLMVRNREDEARKIMTRVAGAEYAEKEITEIKESAKKSDGGNLTYGQQWRVLLSKKMRLVLLVALSIAVFQMVSGLNNVFFFGPKIFKLAGASMSPFMQSNIIGLVMVIMTIISMVVIDKLGRKSLLYIGVSIVAISSLVVGFSFNSAKYNVEVTPEQNDIEIVTTGIVNAAIQNIAKQNDKVFAADAIKENAGYYELYKEGKVVSKISMSEESIINAIADAEKVRILLTELKDEGAATGGFEELEFNKKLKSKIEAAGLVSTNYGLIKDAMLELVIKLNSMLVLIGIAGIVVGFSISLGPITWALLSEIFPNNIRGLGISVAGTLNGITSWVVSTLFPWQLENIGAGLTYFIYGVLMVIAVICVAWFYPETKGKSLEEIEKELVKE